MLLTTKCALLSYILSSYVIAGLNITRIVIEDKNTTKAGDYTDDGGKEITLSGDGKEKIEVFPKKNLFSKNSKIFNCGETGCAPEKISAKQKRKLNNCNFEGKFKGDPDSRINLNMCDKQGSQNLVILSDKVNTSNLYRVEPSGDIKTIPQQNFTDTIKEEIVDIKDSSQGNDYAMEYDAIPAAIFSIKDKVYAILLEDVNADCCKPIRTHCIRKDGEKKCSKDEGTTLCNSQKKKFSCQQLKSFLIRKGLKDRMSIQKEIKKKENKEKKEKKPKKPSKPDKKEVKKDEKKMKKKKQEEEEKVEKKKDKEEKKVEKQTEEDDDEFEEEDLDEAETEEEKSKTDQKKKDGKKGDSKSKSVSDVTNKELLDIAKQLQKTPKDKKKNPKCTKKSVFRSAIVIMSGCPTCRMKEPIPSKKIYTKRTVELGVFIDPPLYKRMSKLLDTAEEEKVKTALVELVHNVLIETETFLTHKSLTTFKGGFKLAINGIHIYKDENEDTNRWSSATSVLQILNEFGTWASEVNDPCDAEENSYDGMILFTGRLEEMSDVREGSTKGYAYSNAVCGTKPAVVLTIRLEEGGQHNIMAPRLLSHEMVHLLGSNHDGAKNIKDPDSPYYQKDIPCPENDFLMSPTVYETARTFSTCTQKMIDHAQKGREKEKKDCFYT